MRIRSMLMGISMLTASMQVQASNTKLINGEPVDRADWKEVVWLRGCTATAVGPRVIVTASHCVRSGGSVQFTIDDESYVARTYRNPRYTGSPYYHHDLAVGITDKDIADVKWASIGGEATTGTELTILGYGCIRPGGGGGNDGVLRMGTAEITGFNGTDMISSKGAGLCYGDSGGPAFVLDDEGHRFLLGINSKGNIRDTNWNARTDLEASREFFQNIADERDVEICGINLDCMW